MENNDKIISIKRIKLSIMKTLILMKKSDRIMIEILSIIPTSLMLTIMAQA